MKAISQVSVNMAHLKIDKVDQTLLKNTYEAYHYLLQTLP